MEEENYKTTKSKPVEETEEQKDRGMILIIKTIKQQESSSSRPTKDWIIKFE